MPTKHIRKAMLVYQAGIANVFSVKRFTLAPSDRETRRLLQSDFRGAEMFARGLGAAGVTVRTAACNAAGDIQYTKWSYDLDSQPFSDQFVPVHTN